MSDDIFNGPEGPFAERIAGHVRTAIYCNAEGEPWPAWSGREYIAVAIALCDRKRLEAEGFPALRTAVEYVREGMTHPPASEHDTAEFFAAIRARGDAEAFWRDWDRRIF